MNCSSSLEHHYIRWLGLWKWRTLRDVGEALWPQELQQLETFFWPVYPWQCWKHCLEGVRVHAHMLLLHSFYKQHIQLAGRLPGSRPTWAQMTIGCLWLTVIVVQAPAPLKSGKAACSRWHSRQQLCSCGVPRAGATWGFSLRQAHCQGTGWCVCSRAGGPWAACKLAGLECKRRHTSWSQQQRVHPCNEAGCCSCWHKGFAERMGGADSGRCCCHTAEGEACRSFWGEHHPSMLQLCTPVNSSYR